MEVEPESGVELEIAGMNLHGSVAELLRNVEALRVAGATGDEPLSEVEIRRRIEVITKRGAMLLAQALPNVVLAIGVIWNHDVGADLVIDQSHVGAHMRPEEAVSLRP